MKFENSLAARDFYAAKTFHLFIRYSPWGIVWNYKITQHSCHELEKFLLYILKDLRTLPLLKYIQGWNTGRLMYWKDFRRWGLLFSQRLLWILRSCSLRYGVVTHSSKLTSRGSPPFGCPCNKRSIILHVYITYDPPEHMLHRDHWAGLSSEFNCVYVFDNVW
jgi:hypothetical protein